MSFNTGDSTVSVILIAAAARLESIYSADVFGQTSVDKGKAALSALKPIGQTPDHYSAAGARNAARLLRLWAEEGLPPLS